MKPRVASWYENRLGRNDGNPLYVSHVIKRDYPDIEFHHLIPDPNLQFESLGKFDMHLWVDWGEDALAGVLPYEPIKCPSPCTYWASDTHLGYGYRLERARQCSRVFVAQKQAGADFATDGVIATWLPHAVEPQVYNPAAVYAHSPMSQRAAADTYRLKRWDIGFVGHLNDQARIDALDRMFSEFPNSRWGSLRTGRKFEHAADIYTQSKIVFNTAINQDINMRVFEALATRSCLLTPWVPHLEELFMPGVHLLVYKDLNDAVEKARYYLEHDDEREKIAAAGYKEVLGQHTMAHRVRALLGDLAPELARGVSGRDAERGVSSSTAHPQER